MVDNTDEKIVEETDNAAEEESFETADELKKVKANKEFVARDNTAQIQIFIQNAHFRNKEDLKLIRDLASLNTGADKKYDLKRREDCSEFFSTCKSREYIVLAMVLSVFEIVSIGDYANLKNTLAVFLPEILHSDKEGKDVYTQQSNPYISLDMALSAVGGKVFVADGRQHCIGYGDGGERVLDNIWTQFPDLRRPMIDWLLKTNEMFEYRTSFEAYQIVGAFVRVIMADFHYAEKNLFDRLYSQQSNLGLLARLAQELLKEERFRTDTQSMVLGWMNSEGSWLWKPALLVCLHTYNPDVDNHLHKAMLGAVKKRMFEFTNSDLNFIVVFSWSSRNVRNIITSAFCDLFQLCGLQKRKNLTQIYLKIIRYGYYRVNRNRTELPFVVCDTKEQMEKMRFILTFIMGQYDLYCQLCRILQVYLEEVSGYKASKEMLDHLTAFFYVLAENESDYCKDILFFCQR